LRFTEYVTVLAEAIAKRWRIAVAAHQAGATDEAITGYRGVLAEQPGYAPAHYLLGLLLCDRGETRIAEDELAAAVAAAPGYVDARCALANLQRA
jgi:Tfp pilus assembly protein PilF